MDLVDGHTLLAASDLMSVDSLTGSIFVSLSKPAGTYQIKIIGTLSDSWTTTSQVFTINIAAPAVNSLPYF